MVETHIKILKDQSEKVKWFEKLINAVFRSAKNFEFLIDNYSFLIIIKDKSSLTGASPINLSTAFTIFPPRFSNL